MARTIINPEWHAEGRAAADEDWAAGTVWVKQDLFRRYDSDYANGYWDRIEELKAEHSYRAPRS